MTTQIAPAADAPLLLESPFSRYAALATFRRVCARLSCSTVAGRTLAWFFRDRIPGCGGWFRVGGGNILPELKASLFWGWYERSERLLVRRFLRSDCDVVELGSSIGVVATAIARQIGGQRLFCVEANPHLLPLLEVNLRENAPTAAIRIRYGAVGDGRPRVKFRIAPESTKSSVIDEGAGTIEVPGLTLRQIVEEEQLNRYVLVADIEGAERFILSDPRVLDSCQQLIIELHDHPDGAISIADLVKGFERNGFEVAARRGAVFVLNRPGHACADAR